VACFRISYNLLRGTEGDNDRPDVGTLERGKNLESPEYGAKELNI
jgi:hypothetical protein